MITKEEIQLLIIEKVQLLSDTFDPTAVKHLVAEILDLSEKLKEVDNEK